MLKALSRDLLIVSKLFRFTFLKHSELSTLSMFKIVQCHGSIFTFLQRIP